MSTHKKRYKTAPAFRMLLICDDAIPRESISRYANDIVGKVSTWSKGILLLDLKIVWMTLPSWDSAKVNSYIDENFYREDFQAFATIYEKSKFRVKLARTEKTLPVTITQAFTANPKNLSETVSDIMMHELMHGFMLYLNGYYGTSFNVLLDVHRTPTNFDDDYKLIEPYFERLRYEKDPRKTPSGSLRVGTGKNDMIADKNSVIKYRVVIEDGDWESFRSKEESQRTSKYDAYNCTHGSSENGFEAQANRMLQLRMWPNSALAFFNGKNSLNAKYIVDGKFDFSMRFNTKLGGNVPGVGNWAYKAHDSIRNDGLVPESVWPVTETEKEYYAEVSPEAIKLGQESLEHYTWLYHRLTGKNLKYFEKYMKLAPIQIGLGLCSDWWSGKPKPCGAKPTHQVLLEHMVNPLLHVQDQYLPFSKILPWAYPIPFSYQGVLYLKHESPLTDDALFVDVRLGDRGKQVIKLRNALNKLNWEGGEGELYDEELRGNVYKFILANLNRKDTMWTYLWQKFFIKGKSVDKKVRYVINLMLRNIR